MNKVLSKITISELTPVVKTSIEKDKKYIKKIKKNEIDKPTKWKTELCFYDCETVLDCVQKFTMYQIGYKFSSDNDVRIISGFDCASRFLDELHAYSKQNNVKIVLISFNGSWFDDILLMRYIMN